MPRSWSPTIRSLAAGESGIALIAAIAVMLIISLLAAAAVSVSSETATSTTHDEQRKAALAAAEAGVRVATYRLTMLNPEPRECISQTTKEAPAGSFCAAAEETIGNGAGYTYQTTTALAPGEKCVGLEAVSQETLQQRCIAATGVAKGIKVRVEARVASFTAKPLFSVPGIIARERLVMKGKPKVNGAVGSNGVIEAGGASEQIGGCELGPSGKYKGDAKVCEAIKVRTPAEGEIVFAPVNPGNSAKKAPSGECAISQDPEGNCDYRITNGNKKPPVTPYDQVSGKVTFEEATRELSMGANSTVTLGSGVYNFCSLTATKGTLTVAKGAKAVVFIDSPEREGSECPAGSGTLNFGGNIEVFGDENPTDLQIYVYGKTTVKIAGTENIDAVLYAPNASIELTGNFKLDGGIAGNEVSLDGNMAFDWNEAVKALKVEDGVVPAYYRTAWGQCTPEGTTPAIGC